MSKKVFIADPYRPKKSQRICKEAILKWLGNATKLYYKGKKYKLVGIRTKYLFLQSDVEFIYLHYSIRRLAVFKNKIVIDKKRVWKKKNLT